MEQNLTTRFAKGLYVLSRQEMPAHVQHYAKRCLLDYLGATLAGAKLVRSKVKPLLSLLGDEGSSPLVGLPITASLMTAVLVNGLSSHAAELDDGVISAIVHPGSPIISTLLPLAAKQAVNGLSLLRGIIVGYEAAVRLADAIQPGHKLRGYHATATCGTVGAAAAVAAMQGLSEHEFTASIAVALVSAYGTLKVLEDAADLKPFNSGQASVAALTAVSLAKSGFIPPNDPLSGDFGFLNMTADAVDEAHLDGHATDTYAVERVYIKPHAACRYCHSPIDAVLKLRSEHGLQSEDVESVDVRTYELAVRNHDHTEVSTSSAAKMSIPYSVAVALLTGESGMEEFDSRRIEAVNTSGLAQKVVVRADKDLTALYPDRNPAVVTVRTTNGKTYVDRVDYPKGEPVNALSDGELEQKFASLATYRGWNPVRINAAIDQVWSTDSAGDLSALWAVLYQYNEDEE